MLFGTTKVINFGLFAFNGYLWLKYEDSPAMFNALLSGIFLSVQTVMEFIRLKHLSLKKDLLHQENKPDEIRHLKEHIVKQESIGWILFRHTQLMVALLGIHILIPYDSGDLDQEFQMMAINENMAKFSLVVGIFYALIFQETTQNAYVI